MIDTVSLVLAVLALIGAVVGWVMVFSIRRRAETEMLNSMHRRAFAQERITSARECVNRAQSWLARPEEDDHVSLARARLVIAENLLYETEEVL